jgi:hypothetical protein
MGKICTPGEVFLIFFCYCSGSSGEPENCASRSGYNVLTIVPNPDIFRRSIVEFLFRKLHNSEGIIVLIKHAIANVPTVSRSGGVRSRGWAHAHETIRLDQVRVSRTQPVTENFRFDLRVAFGERIPAHYEAGDSRREQYQLSHSVSSAVFSVHLVCVL